MKLRYIPRVLAVVILLWLFASWIDVINHNLDKNPEYQNWNVFEMLFPVKEANAQDSDVILLAKLIQAENGCNSKLCRKLTGIVVMKRVKSRHYPNTIQGVISQRGQYATWIEGNVQRCKPSKENIRLARQIIEQDLQRYFPDNLVFQSEFKQGKQVYKKIKHEYFCLA